MVFTLPKYTDTGSSPILRKSYAKLPEILDVPNLIKIQLDSFRWFQEVGLRQLFEEVSPIKDFTGNRLEIDFIGYEFRDPRYMEQECRLRDLTYSAPLYVKTRLLVKGTGEIKEQDIFFGDVPLMTSKGTFITGGAERVVVSQLLRSPGVYLVTEEDPTSGRKLCQAKLIPSHGAWLEFETNNHNVISVKINGKRKIPATTLLRALGYGSDEELLNLFSKEDNSPDRPYITSTIERDSSVRDESEALINPEAVLVVENWQENLKKVTMRITWDDPDTGERKTYERHIYVHSDSHAEISNPKLMAWRALRTNVAF